MHDEPSISARAVYRFWRDTGPAGVDICLLGMADYLATYGTSLATQSWVAYLESIQILLESYFLRPRQAVSPDPVITGDDLRRLFNMEQGPQIGEILEKVREAQVEGIITEHAQAVEWVHRFLQHRS
jgi:hypothetical protein